MTAKGLDFPYVTLVGVILADGGLNVPDFRAGERTFQLLTQVAGRSGRGSQAGRCIIQTYNPLHYSITTSARQNYLDFFKEEIKFREELHYPPICRFIRVLIRGNVEVRVRGGAETLARSIGGGIIGPSPAPLSRLRGKYRWQFCMKTKDINPSRKIIRDAIKKAGAVLKGLDIIIDVDPVDMM